MQRPVQALPTLSDRFLAAVAVAVATGPVEMQDMAKRIEANLKTYGPTLNPAKKADMERLLVWLKSHFN
jgi:hypothetical protein